MPEKKTFNIQGVEIFSTGKWNGDEYSRTDLEDIVNAFEENKQGARPHIKLGHDPKQKLLQSDGLPAAGWVERVYIKGDKLVADFVDIPRKVYDLIVTKAYRKVSSEIFWNITIGKKTYKRMLSAVALLGSDTPGVMNLNDILSMYNLKESFEKIGQGEVLDLKLFDLEETIKKEHKKMPTDLEVKLEKEAEELKAKAAATEAELKEFKLKDDEAKKALEISLKENEELKKFKADAIVKEESLKAEKETAEKEKFYTELVSEGLATPAMKEYVMDLCGPEKKEYTSKKMLKKEDVVKEMLKLFKAGKDVNLDEGSAKGKEEKKNFELEMDKKANEYAKENKCSYSAALKAVMADGKKK